MYHLFLFCLLAGAIHSTTAQVSSWGRCPKVTVQSDFELEPYLGKWYENRRFYNTFEKGQICAHANYSIKDNGRVKVLNGGLVTKTQKPNNIEGEAYQPNKEEPGKLLVRFFRFQPWGKYWVLSTDYENYSVVFSCSSFGIFNLQFAWILTRKANPEQAVIDKALTVLKKNGVDTGKLLVTEQSCKF